MEAALEGLPGISKAEVSFESGKARVQYDREQVGVVDIERAVREAGFGVQVIAD